MIDLININLEIISFALIMNKYVNTMYVICKLKKKRKFSYSVRDGASKLWWYKMCH